MRIVSCTRAEALVYIGQEIVGWSHLCKPKLQDRALRAYERVLEGSETVTCGQTTYRIQEADAA